MCLQDWRLRADIPAPTLTKVELPPATTLRSNPPPRPMASPRPRARLPPPPRPKRARCRRWSSATLRFCLRNSSCAMRSRSTSPRRTARGLNLEAPADATAAAPPRAPPRPALMVAVVEVDVVEALAGVPAAGAGASLASLAVTCSTEEAAGGAASAAEDSGAAVVPAAAPRPPRPAPRPPRPPPRGLPLPRPLGGM